MNVALCMRIWREVRNFAWHRSQYFSFEPDPESALRSEQEPIKLFKEPIKIFLMMLAVVKQQEINWEVCSDQCRHIYQRYDTGWELLQLTESPWTTEASTRERWRFGALTNRKATSSNRDLSLTSLFVPLVTTFNYINCNHSNSRSPSDFTLLLLGCTIII